MFLHLKNVFKSELEPRKSISPLSPPISGLYYRRVLKSDTQFEHVAFSCSFLVQNLTLIFLSLCVCKGNQIDQNRKPMLSTYVSGQEYLTSHSNRMDNCVNFFFVQ